MPHLQIEKLIKTVNMDKLMDEQIEAGANKLIQDNPGLAAHKKEIVKLYQEILDKKEFHQFLTKMFGESFSDKDVQAIISFYESGPGQKMLSKLPAITRASIEFNYDRMKKHKSKVDALFAKIDKTATQAKNKPGK